MLNADNVIHDPTGTQYYNRYSYAFNNPLKFTDPTGWTDHPVVQLPVGAGAAGGGSTLLGDDPFVGALMGAFTNFVASSAPGLSIGASGEITNPDGTPVYGPQSPPANGVAAIIAVVLPNQSNTDGSSAATATAGSTTIPMDPNIVFNTQDANTSVPVYTNSTPADVGGGDKTVKTIQSYTDVFTAFISDPIELAKAAGAQALQDAPTLETVGKVVGYGGAIINAAAVIPSVQAQGGDIQVHNVLDVDATLLSVITPIGIPYLAVSTYTEYKYGISPTQYLQQQWLNNGLYTPLIYHVNTGQ